MRDAPSFKSEKPGAACIIVQSIFRSLTLWTLVLNTVVQRRLRRKAVAKLCRRSAFQLRFGLIAIHKIECSVCCKVA